MNEAFNISKAFHGLTAIILGEGFGSRSHETKYVYPFPDWFQFAELRAWSVTGFGRKNSEAEEERDLSY